MVKWLLQFEIKHGNIILQEKLYNEIPTRISAVYKARGDSTVL